MTEIQITPESAKDLMRTHGAGHTYVGEPGFYGSFTLRRMEGTTIRGMHDVRKGPDFAMHISSALDRSTKAHHGVDGSRDGSCSVEQAVIHGCTFVGAKRVSVRKCWIREAATHGIHFDCDVEIADTFVEAGRQVEGRYWGIYAQTADAPVIRRNFVEGRVMLGKDGSNRLGYDARVHQNCFLGDRVHGEWDDHALIANNTIGRKTMITGGARELDRTNIRSSAYRSSRAVRLPWVHAVEAALTPAANLARSHEFGSDWYGRPEERTTTIGAIPYEVVMNMASKEIGRKWGRISTFVDKQERADGMKVSPMWLQDDHWARAWGVGA